MAPAAERHFGLPVQRIEHFGSYACRNVYGRPDATRSRHATAEAFDVAGFVLADGRRSVSSVIGTKTRTRGASYTTSATALAESSTASLAPTTTPLIAITCTSIEGRTGSAAEFSRRAAGLAAAPGSCAT